MGSISVCVCVCGEEQSGRYDEDETEDSKVLSCVSLHGIDTKPVSFEEQKLMQRC